LCSYKHLHLRAQILHLLFQESNLRIRCASLTTTRRVK
jgi:hypothetical protein